MYFKKCKRRKLAACFFWQFSVEFARFLVLILTKTVRISCSTLDEKHQRRWRGFSKLNRQHRRFVKFYDEDPTSLRACSSPPPPSAFYRVRFFVRSSVNLHSDYRALFLETLVCFNGTMICYRESERKDNACDVNASRFPWQRECGKLDELYEYKWDAGTNWDTCFHF